MSIIINKIIDYLEELDIEYSYVGNTEFKVKKYSSLNNVKENSITWIKNKTYYNEEFIESLKDILIVIKSDIKIDKITNKNIGYIICENPKQVFFSILDKFFTQQKYKDHISPKSIVETTKIGENSYIGHNCYIGKDVVIGNNVVIKNNVSIEGKVQIGNDTLIHSGVVIGTDGFGYFQDNSGNNKKVPHYGGVIIGNDVEIGANTCIDRGTLDDTIIGNNVKIDNLCHIGHNVVIKDNSMVIALSLLGGSVILEKDAYIAPGAIIKNQLIIGENSLVGMGAVVTKDVKSNKVVAGIPAKVIRDNK